MKFLIIFKDSCFNTLSKVLGFLGSQDAPYQFNAVAYALLKKCDEPQTFREYCKLHDPVYRYDE